MAFQPVPFRLEFWLQSGVISDGKNIKNNKKSSPEQISPEGRKQLGVGGRHHSTPIGKLQKENKKEKEERESFENLAPPQVAETDQKEGERFTDRMILFLKLANLRRFLLNNLRMEFFLLNKNTITIETNKFLVGPPQIEPVGRAATHRAPGQKPLVSAVPGHPD